MQREFKNLGIDILLGVATGDALGVPYEFSSTEQMKTRPAKDMVGYKVHHPPPGTWSDDTSLTLCLAETIVEGYSLKLCAEKFIAWKDKAYWSARNTVFDIGITTRDSIYNLNRILSNGEIAELENLRLSASEMDNGNGSLMRILPMIFLIVGKPISEQLELIWKNSALTHKHIRAAMACMIYLKFVEFIIAGNDKNESYEKTRTAIIDLWEDIDFSEKEMKIFGSLITNDIRDLHQTDIRSGGYVIESLEASLWCFLKEETFEKTVLAAVNLGHDTDTTAAIVGGVAGVYYGFNQIPEYWRFSLARMEDIISLGRKLKTNW